MTGASPGEAAAVSQRSMRPGNVLTLSVESTPIAAVLSRSAAATNFRRLFGSSRPNPSALSHHRDARHGKLRRRLVPARSRNGQSLKFSGYDYFFRIINGGHVAGYYDLLSRSDELPLERLAAAGQSRAECSPRARHHPAR